MNKLSTNIQEDSPNRNNTFHLSQQFTITWCQEKKPLTPAE